jgi:UrcA family protein
MSLHSHLKPVTRLALLASAVLLLATAPAANAQDRYRNASYSDESREQVIVIAPRVHEERGATLGIPSKVSMSQPVPYDDLDLRTRTGAHELRLRVADTARNICDRLADNYPYREVPGRSCYKEAVSDAMIRVNEAIRDARD